MDDETADLIRMLCTKAGTLMEDASAEALMMGSTDPQALSAKLEHLTQAAEPICAVVAAARALLPSTHDC